QQLLAGKVIVIRARLRAVYRSAVPPQRRANRPNASAAGALLLPQLLARAGDQLAVLGRVRAGALRCAVVLYRLPQQVFVYRAKDFIGQLQLANLLAFEI